MSLSFNQGLYLQGDTHVVLSLSARAASKVDRVSVDRVKQIIDRRVNELGLTEPLIQQEGANRIIVELPGISDPEKAVALLGKTALLEFRDEAGKVGLTGKDLKNSQAQVNGQQNVIALEFSDEGAKKFEDMTRKNVNRKIGIYLDNELLTDPMVNEAITGGKAVITGQRDLQEAQRIALLLRSGALPVKVEILEIRTVGPTLGEDSKAKSEKAFTIGIALIFTFMLLFYRASGVVAIIALLLYILLTLGALKLLEATLTLPGIAGVILSVGMAVDANVLIFERFKEELRAGKTLRVAMELGFNRAFSTIVDSNVTTLFAAVVLFFLGTGPIKGFAVTLTVGIIISMFTAITVTKYLLITLIRTNLIKDPRFFGK